MEDNITIADRIGLLLYSTVPNMVGRTIPPGGSMRRKCAEVTAFLESVFYSVSPFLKPETIKEINKNISTIYDKRYSMEHVYLWLNQVYAPMMQDSGLKQLLLKFTYMERGDNY